MGYKTKLQSNNTDLQGILSTVLTLSTLRDVFSDNSWENIIWACQNNVVPASWVVGDNKIMIINGSSYQIDIIGKNHDVYSDGSGIAPLTLQFHDCYATTYAMNDSDTSSGGWESSVMRNTNLPSIKALMPTAVQNAIKNVDKTTSVDSAIITTEDGLFLLSEVEVFGKTTYSATGEGSQYEYYSASNSKIKNLSNSAMVWWQRSVLGGTSTEFTCVDATGNPSYSGFYNDNLLGVTPAFCFGVTTTSSESDSESTTEFTFNPTDSGGTSYKSKLNDNNIDLQRILEMAQSLPEAVTIITFTIDGTEYQAELNMLWSSWVESEYNTGGFTISDSGYISASDGIFSVLDSDYNTIYSTDTIKTGYSYVLM